MIDKSMAQASESVIPSVAVNMEVQRDLFRSSDDKPIERTHVNITEFSLDQMINFQKAMKTVEWPERAHCHDHGNFVEMVEAEAKRQLDKGIPDPFVAEHLHHCLSSMKNVAQKYSREFNGCNEMTLKTVMKTLENCDRVFMNKGYFERFIDLTKSEGEDFFSLTRRLAEIYDKRKLGAPSFDQNHRANLIKNRVCEAGNVPRDIIESLAACYDLNLLPDIIERALENKRKDIERQATPPLLDEVVHDDSDNGSSQGLLERNHGCEMVTRAPRGFERLKQHKNKLMCAKCRRWDHRKENCCYTAFCSYCGEENHSNKNHRNGAKTKKYPISGPNSGDSSVSSF